MAYTPCTTGAITGNAQQDCANPATDGLLVLGVAVAKKDIVGIAYGATPDLANTASAITLSESAKVCVIEANGETAWADSGYEFDPATKSWTKNAIFIAPDYGASISAKVLDPMAKNSDGYVVILQRKNTRGAGSFVIIGAEKGAVVTAMTMNMTDPATSGCASVTLTETGAKKGEINLFSEDYTTTKALFDALVAKAY